MLPNIPASWSINAQSITENQSTESMNLKKREGEEREPSLIIQNASI